MSASKLAVELCPYNEVIEGLVPYRSHPDECSCCAALDEMALRVFEDARERAAKIAADAIAPNRRDIADAIRAMQPDPCPK